MARKAFGLVLTAALAFSWAAPLCARSIAPSHACCIGKEAPAPSPSNGDAPACCRALDALPPVAAAAVLALAPALPPSAVIAESPRVRRVAPRSFIPAKPQAPPGTHSGLSPPSSGL